MCSEWLKILGGAPQTPYRHGRGGGGLLSLDCFLSKQLFLPTCLSIYKFGATAAHVNTELGLTLISHLSHAQKVQVRVVSPLSHSSSGENLFFSFQWEHTAILCFLTEC